MHERSYASSRAGRGVSQSAAPRVDDSTAAYSPAGRAAGLMRQAMLTFGCACQNQCSCVADPDRCALLPSFTTCFPCKVMLEPMDVFIEKIQKQRINGKYSLICKIGEGGFGAVYRGQYLARSTNHCLLNCTRQGPRQRPRRCSEARTQVDRAVYSGRGGREIRRLPGRSWISGSVLVWLA